MTATPTPDENCEESENDVQGITEGDRERMRKFLETRNANDLIPEEESDDDGESTFTPTKVNDELCETFLHENREGKTLKTIANEYGVSHTTIATHLNRQCTCEHPTDRTTYEYGEETVIKQTRFGYRAEYNGDVIEANTKPNLIRKIELHRQRLQEDGEGEVV